MKQRFEVKCFGELMEQNLLENESKGGWHDCTYSHLFGRLIEECYELMNAVLHGESAEAVASEAADVGNFAMMIANNSGRDERRRTAMERAEAYFP